MHQQKGTQIMERKVEKRVTTTTRIRLTIEEIEAIIIKHLKHKDSWSMEWDVSDHFVKGVVITNKKEIIT